MSNSPTVRRPVSVRAIATAVPPAAVTQSEVSELFAQQSELTPLARRLIRSAFSASAIDRRYTVLAEVAALASTATDDNAARSPDAAGARHLLQDASTGERNAVYAREAPALALRAASDAIEKSPGIARADITHVVTVSCTGFFAPGPDYTLVRDLGLGPATRRLHVGFMGCYGAFPALRAAVSTCVAEPDAVVLVVCVELCSVHVRSSNDPDQIVASSVFGDGAAAAVVTARPAPGGTSVLQVDAQETTLTDGGEADMAWTIGDVGFEMVLSSYVPRIIEAQIADALAPLWAQVGVDAARPTTIERWAVHPGGRAILDRVQSALDLTDEQMVPSREVLREYGNMSSATVLFILQRILEGATPVEAERVAAMAFGPGLRSEPTAPQRACAACEIHVLLHSAGR